MVLEMKSSVAVEIRTDKNTYRPAETVTLTVTATNKNVLPVQLLFTSSQRYDFTILKNTREIWCWSNDKMFAMQMETVILQPEEKLTYAEIWNAESILESGEYEAVGTIMAQPSLRVACKFKIEK